LLPVLLERYPEENLKLIDREIMVTKPIDSLIRRFVFFEPSFGSEQELLDSLIKIIYALLS
jgi:hypothetical protein